MWRLACTDTGQVDVCVHLCCPLTVTRLSDGEWDCNFGQSALQIYFVMSPVFARKFIKSAFLIRAKLPESIGNFFPLFYRSCWSFVPCKDIRRLLASGILCKQVFVLLVQYTYDSKIHFIVFKRFIGKHAQGRWKNSIFARCLASHCIVTTYGSTSSLYNATYGYWRCACS